MEDWNKNNNVGLVVGATRPDEISDIRKITGDMPFLMPGVGAQGADVQALMEHGQGGPMIINSSRAVLYASNGSDFSIKAREVANATRIEVNSHKIEQP